MKTCFLFCVLTVAIAANSQPVAVFKDFTFDSTYSLVALSTAFSDPARDPQEFSFYVNNLNDLTEMQRQWVLTTKRPRVSIEHSSIDLYLLKGGYLVSSRWMIYPEQGIMHYGDSWYDFDMKKFRKVQQKHALHYHSQRFAFDSLVDFAFFRDSLQGTPNFLFLFEPGATKFKGSFNVILPGSGDSNGNLFAMSDLNKELKAKFPSETFEVSMVINDSFNLANKNKLRLKVECAKTFYEKFRGEGKETEDWMPYKLETRVIFKD